MVQQSNLPTVNVLSVVRSSDAVTVEIEISREDYLRYPVAPADLRQLDTCASVFPLHQLVGRTGPRLVFETYQPELALPQVGTTYEFCSWWVPQAMDAVRDPSAAWQRLAYPDNGDHDHCLLTWEAIASYAEHKEGYCSVHGWITVAAYREFIEQDKLRVRTNWRGILGQA
jgi:hypothetical protein